MCRGHFYASNSRHTPVCPPISVFLVHIYGGASIGHSKPAGRSRMASLYIILVPPLGAICSFRFSFTPVVARVFVACIPPLTAVFLKSTDEERLRSYVAPLVPDVLRRIFTRLRTDAVERRRSVL